MASAVLQSTELTESQFGEIRALVKNTCGISLGDEKMQLVKARLNKRLRKLSLADYDEYINFLRRDRTGNELTAMLDAISTNLTSFFREADHFDYLEQGILKRKIAEAANEKSPKRLRVWSAGCSSGEEPYSIAIVACSSVPNLKSWDAAVLATDLSTRMLERATNGVYSAERVKTVNPQLRSRYFECIQTRPDRLYRVNNTLRSFVHFSRLNLMGDWPMRGPFDVIFCRNVMIYFDKATQTRLVERFWELLAPRGTLFIGHSESLTSLKHRFKYVQPTVYEKAA
ncbi:MAG: protein-glutamate O-methyltransferase [Phycisphaerae bacterium]|nr:protein-glutamate O-methyltransferase [Phycisphaerae bacterium]